MFKPTGHIIVSVASKSIVVLQQRKAKGQRQKSD
jgi:hypothetical protein